MFMRTKSETFLRFVPIGVAALASWQNVRSRQFREVSERLQDSERQQIVCFVDLSDETLVSQQNISGPYQRATLIPPCGGDEA
jgi:hypothetical protein